MKKISVFGLGYVGCVSLGCLAKMGNKVVGIDINDHKINLINQGKPSIIEKEIGSIIYEEWNNRKLYATNDFHKAVGETDISLICVGTPAKNDGNLNLNFIFNTAKQIGQVLREKNTFHVIVIRSTVLPGTNKKYGEIIERNSKKKRNKDFAIVTNPEFMREGSAVHDFYNPPLTLLACDNEKAIKIMRELYEGINAPIEITDINVAEIIKYVNNSFHALKVSFANEVGNICKKLSIDSHKVMDIFCKDKYLNISSYYFRPGFAYGGSCLTKDLKGLKTLSHQLSLDAPILDAIERSNDNQKKLAFKMIIEKEKMNIGVLGLSFKIGTDDLRYSPMVEITEKLLKRGCSVLIYDENISLSKLLGVNKRYIEKHIPYMSELITDDFDYVIQNSDLLVISHNDSKYLNLHYKYPDKIIIDLVKINSENVTDNYDGICW